MSDLDCSGALLGQVPSARVEAVFFGALSRATYAFHLALDCHERQIYAGLVTDPTEGDFVYILNNKGIT